MTARSRSSGEAMRICMMSQPTLTMCATTRCATKPGESLITDTGTPSAASRPCAASRTSGWVTGVVISVRRLRKPKRGSTATVRVGSRPSSRAVVVASLPRGATKQTAAREGSLSILGKSSFNSGTAHTESGRALGAGGSATGSAVPSSRYAYQPRPVLRPRRPAARLGEKRRPVFRLLVVLLVHRLHHRMRHVEPNEIHQAERPEAETGGVDQDAVDGGEIGDAFGEHAQRLGDESAPGVVDDEAGRVLAAYRRVAEAPGKRRESVRHPRLRAHAIHHFDDLQHGNRVEEVIARDAAGAPAGRGHGGHGKRGSVGRQDAALRNDVFERTE